MEDTSLMTGTDVSAERTWRNTCSPTRFVTVEEDRDKNECDTPQIAGRAWLTAAAHTAVF